MSSPLAIQGGTPVLDNTQHLRWPVITQADRAAVMAVLDRGVLSGPFAPEVRALEQAFARFAGVRHALATNSGTAAIHVALAAAGIGPGDEVITSAYSFVATALAVLHQGAVPIFVDIEPRSFGLNPSLLEGAITPRTRAVLPVHIHGTPCDLDPMLEICRRRGIPLIEDACQAHGAIYRGRSVGSIGAMGCFSTQSSKILACGEGGVFVTDDPELVLRANRTRMFGEDIPTMEDSGWNADRPLDAARAYDSSTVGWMYRTNELSAALARSQLARVSAWNDRGRRSARRLSARLAGLPGVRPPFTPEGSVEVVHKYRVRLDARALGIDAPPRRVRDAMIRALRAEGLEVVVWQTLPVPGQRVFRERNAVGGGAPWNLRPFVDYDLGQFPETTSLLDDSIVLFSQSCPILPQHDEVIDAYATAFERVWPRLGELLSEASS